MVQSAPILLSTIYVYSSVAVPRGTIAIAAGGQPIFSAVYNGGVFTAPSTTGVTPAGVVSATFNGGFSWLNMPFSGNFINDITVQSSNPQKTYTLIAVTDRYTAWRTTFNATTVSNVLLGTQLGANVQPQFTWTAITLPGTTTTTGPSAYAAAIVPINQLQGAHLLGVVFDNPQVGWIFGYTTILRTSNGGLTWFNEAPFQIAAQPVAGQGVGQAVFGLAPVPTSY